MHRQYQPLFVPPAPSKNRDNALGGYLCVNCIAIGGSAHNLSGGERLAAQGGQLNRRPLTKAIDVRVALPSSLPSGTRGNRLATCPNCSFVDRRICPAT